MENTTDATRANSRISGLDLARCLAFCGMVIVNYRVLSGWLLRGPEWLVSFADFFTGRAAATFVILAGAGMMLLYRARRDGSPSTSSGALAKHVVFLLVMAVGMIAVGFNADLAHTAQTPKTFPNLVATLGAEPTQACDGLTARWTTFLERTLDGAMQSYFLSCAGILLASLVAFFVLRPRFPAQWTFFNRSLFLFGFGYVWYPYWSGDILHFYGLYLLLGSLILGLRSRWLILLMALTLVTGLLLQYHFDFQQGWQGYEYVPTEFWSLEGGLRNLFFNGWHPFFPWFAFLLIGMLLVRLDIRRRAIHAAFIIIGSALFVAAEEAAPAVQSIVDAQIMSTYASETTQPSGGIDLAPATDASIRRPTFGKGITRTAHGDAIRGATRLLQALRRKPVGGMEDTRPRGLENFSARVALNHQAIAVCTLSGRLKTDAQQEPTTAALASWVTDQMQAQPKAQAWGDDKGWPAEASVVQLNIVSSNSANLHTTTIPLDAAMAQVGWRRLRIALNTSSENPGMFYIFSATGTSLIVLGLSLLLCSFRFGERLRQPLVLAGQCALTLYVGHVLVGWTIIDLLDKSAGQSMAFVLTACAICWWIGISFAALWRSIFGRGPLEMFMRSIT